MNKPTISATRARTELTRLLSRAEFKSERILIERQGKAVAALISAEDLQLLEYLEDVHDAAAARAALAEQGDEPLEKFDDAVKDIFDGAYDAE